MDLIVEIGNRVRKTREYYKMTREQLAEKAHISPQFLVHIENGTKSMTSNTIFNLAKALTVTSDYLLYGSQGTDLNRVLAAEAMASMSPAEREMTGKVLQVVLDYVRNLDIREDHQ